MTVTERRAGARPRARAEVTARFDARALPWTRLLLALALVGTFAAQARTLSFYFFQDDYVPYGEIVSNGTREYVRQLFLAQDLTPNWRVIPGVLYLATYKLFGMDPRPMHVIMLVLHLGTAALLYRAVVRTTGIAWAAFVAALAFGLHPAYAGTLGQVASVPHVASAFFLAATLNAVIECTRMEGAASLRWLAAAVALYVLALMSNESMAAMSPTFAVAFLALDHGGDARSRFIRAALRSAPFAALGLFAVLAVRQCDCTEASSVYGLDNAHRAFLIYSGRLAYPIGLEPPTYIDAPHLYAGIALIAAALAMLAFGPAIGRIGAAWMALGILPHIFIETHTANRFTYLATPGFALLAAAAAIVAAGWMRRIDARAPLVAGAFALGFVAPWYAMQTHLQNEPWRQTTARWQRLHDDAKAAFPSVPAGARVEVVGGPLVHPLDNFFVMPALARTMWGPDAGLQTFGEDDPYATSVRTGANPFAMEYRDGHYVPLR
jgi:hypothetical protein